MTAADGRAHTTDGNEQRAAEYLGHLRCHAIPCPDCRDLAAAFDFAEERGYERRRAAEDGQRLRERVEARIDALAADGMLLPGAAAALRAALRDGTGDGR